MHVHRSPAAQAGLPGKPACLAPCALPLQRLLVQTSVQAKSGHVSPLQLTSIQVPQQVSLPGVEDQPCGLLGSVLTGVEGRALF